MGFPEITQDSIGNPAGLQIIQGNLLGLAGSLTGEEGRHTLEVPLFVRSSRSAGRCVPGYLEKVSRFLQFLFCSVSWARYDALRIFPVN